MKETWSTTLIYSRKEAETLLSQGGQPIQSQKMWKVSCLVNTARNLCWNGYCTTIWKHAKWNCTNWNQWILWKVVSNKMMWTYHAMIPVKKYACLEMESLGPEEVQKTNDMHRVSQRVRTLSRLMLECRKEKPIPSFSSLLTCDNFDVVIRAAKAMTFEESTSFTLAQKLGNYLGHIVMGKVGIALRMNDSTQKQEAHDFKNLLDCEWNKRVNKIAQKKKNLRDQSTLPEIPWASDLVKLRDHVVEEYLNAAKKRDWRTNGRRLGETKRHTSGASAYFQQATRIRNNGTDREGISKSSIVHWRKHGDRGWDEYYGTEICQKVRMNIKSIYSRYDQWRLGLQVSPFLEPLKLQLVCKFVIMEIFCPFTYFISYMYKHSCKHTNDLFHVS